MAFPKRREFPRIPFKAGALVIKPDSGEVVVAHTTELGQFGCFVQASKSLRCASKIHIEIDHNGDTFSASGRVAYVTGTGMGIAFGLVELSNNNILAKWLSQHADSEIAEAFEGFDL